MTQDLIKRLEGAETSSAEISPCGNYRYSLTRQWGAGPLMGWVMLNPSTADASEDDPTIRRCKGFARDHGYDGIWVANLFPFRATDPKELANLSAKELVPEESDGWIISCALACDTVVCGWGANKLAEARGRRVQDLLEGAGKTPMAFGQTKSGAPRHPLYLPKSALLKALNTEGRDD